MLLARHVDSEVPRLRRLVATEVAAPRRLRQLVRAAAAAGGRRPAGPRPGPGRRRPRRPGRHRPDRRVLGRRRRGRHYRGAARHRHRTAAILQLLHDSHTHTTFIHQTPV